MNARINVIFFPMTPEVLAARLATPLEILLLVKPFRGISFIFTKECPLTVSEDQFRLLMMVNNRIDEVLATIERIEGEALVPAYFAAVLLGTHGYEPEPVHMRYFARPVWDLHISDPRELVKLVEALEFAAESLEEDPCLGLDDIHSGIFDGAVPFDAFDQYVNGTNTLDLFPERAFALV